MQPRYGQQGGNRGQTAGRSQIGKNEEGISPLYGDVGRPEQGVHRALNVASSSPPVDPEQGRQGHGTQARLIQGENPSKLVGKQHRRVVPQTAAVLR